VGCYSDSALLNGAAAQLQPLVCWPDLDSHLNLLEDPFCGPGLEADRVLPGPGAGLGVSLRQNGPLALLVSAGQELPGEASVHAPG